MITKLRVTYPALPPRQVESAGSGPDVPAKTETKARVGWVEQAEKVIAATLIEAIVILGFVVPSLGIGAEGKHGLGPDRPPSQTTPAPAPPSVLTLTVGQATGVRVRGGS